MIEISEEEYKNFLEFKNKKELRTIEEKNYYDRNYFQTVIKFKVKKCDCCNEPVKYNSYCNHLKSKKHLENLEKIKLSID